MRKRKPLSEVFRATFDRCKEALAQQRSQLPPDWHSYEYVRSWTQEDPSGSLWRYEVRRHPDTNLFVQARMPVPRGR